MYLKSVLFVIYFLLRLEVSQCFLMEDLLTKNPTTSAVPGSINNQVAGSSNDRYLQDLINILAEEKAARHQLENLVNQMADKINLMERFHVEVEKELLKERNKTANLENDVAHLKSEVAMNRIVNLTSHIAHSLTDLTPSAGERLVFTNVRLNNGSAYDNTSGMFTAPVSGLYQFHVQLCLNNDMHIYVRIKSDSRSLLESCLIDEGTLKVGCSSLSTIGVLKKSEHVWIEEGTSMSGGTLWQDSNVFQ